MGRRPVPGFDKAVPVSSPLNRIMRVLDCPQSGNLRLQPRAETGVQVTFACTQAQLSTSRHPAGAPGSLRSLPQESRLRRMGRVNQRVRQAIATTGLRLSALSVASTR